MPGVLKPAAGKSTGHRNRPIVFCIPILRAILLLRLPIPPATLPYPRAPQITPLCATIEQPL